MIYKQLNPAITGTIYATSGSSNKKWDVLAKIITNKPKNIDINCNDGIKINILIINSKLPINFLNIIESNDIDNKSFHAYVNFS